MALLQKGNSGDDVEVWQYFLNENGYSVGQIDGVFGSKTEKQTQIWQQDNNLSADGIVGKKTYQKARANGCGEISIFE